jgi:LmbE family N-acetylglucosaminyl deacetylase
MSDKILVKYPVDIGWNYNSVEKTRVVMVSGLFPLNPFPPDRLISQDKSKGKWGFLKTDAHSYDDYHKEVLNRIKINIADSSIIIMPEFGLTEHLEKDILEILKEKDKRCIVIGGSYYHNNNNRIENRCPVIFNRGLLAYQLKFNPSPKEAKYGCEMINPGVINIFTHSGFGDFAVLICSDALDEEWMSQVKIKLRGSIDYLIVIAHNKDATLPDSLRKVSRDEKWIILYCEGSGIGSNEVFSPYRRSKTETNKKSHEENIITKISQGIWEVDLRNHQNYIQQNDNVSLHESLEKHRFNPAPRHGINSSGKSLFFPHNLKILAIGSHFDDIWLGCSATLMLLVEHYKAQVICQCLCEIYPSEYYGLYHIKGEKFVALKKRMDDICSLLGFKEKYFFDDSDGLTDNKFTLESLENIFKKLSKAYYDVDLVFIPRIDDSHMDHVLTAKAAMKYFSHSNLLHYEIKEYGNNSFKPNIIVNVSWKSNKKFILPNFSKEAGISFAEKKAAILENGLNDIMPTLPKVFTAESCLARMIFRANECSKEIKYGEAFYSEIII